MIKIESPRWLAFFGVATVEVVLLIKLLNSQSTPIELLVAICVVAAILVLTPRIEDLIKFNVGKDGLQAELSKLTEKTEKVESQVNRLGDDIKEDVKSKVDQLGEDINDLLISTVLDAYEYITLEKIRGKKESVGYEFNYPKGQDLLERLRNRGLIEETNNNSIFNDRNNRTINLRDHFVITQRGNSYLDAINNKGIGEGLAKIAEK
jgi:hypothetical protein